MPQPSSGTLLFVGCATLDSIALVQEYPAADSRTIADDFATAGGGPAATAAVAAARAGAKVAFAGVLGADEAGDRIIVGLQTEGVDTSAVIRDPHVYTGASVIVVSKATESRAIVTRPVPPIRFPAGSRFHELLHVAEWVHVDHLGWNAVAGLPGLRISVDAGNPIPSFSPKGVELYVPTIERLQAIYGANLKPEALVQKAIDDGATTVVATAGSEGAWGLERGGIPFHVPATPADIVSTLGAGDVYHGAILAAVAAGLPIAEAASFAGRIASASCAGLDGRSMIPRETITSVLTANPTP
ncbi:MULTISPECIES: carbohydrate kinase family protein [Paenarthrobacter]|uniref:carbohydrate kinase family protein n=1 Tax=Paenarthrobacter TaxID=1742992 RepID=UPI00166A7709|nr:MULTISPECIES: PfkB family carbohydrate kinase [Paenarthrobacter]MBP2395142.1 sulfofructose kinase [Paenarthrobacter nicotinovorans]QOT23161.1 ribokinase [Paenarthrobacter sp. YJN-D]UKE98709.1 PfkB family carbohydrate kinase [Paenarthrobacter nicotinovorans]UKF03498.1 PfkB family carbohydrate kinase [Paenarthrobacter nicotinovorans]GGV36771.1 ribokinase [Paenarthrobacter nicotinovorans]